jgi:cytochrome oxidase Cu insertion factor (SCO1/SenC/PrrC family)
MRVVLLGVLLAGVAMQDRAAAAESFKPFKLKALDGSQRSLPDVLGKATVVIFFFPTCQYCNAAFPEVQKIYDAYKDRGLSMVWINVVPDEEPLIAAWRATHGYTIPVLLGGRSVQNDYKLVMTPTHYVLDARGKVLSKHAGYTAGDEKALERDIQQALAQ